MEKNEKKSPKLVVLVLIGVILIVLLGVQVFASVKGYGNVFFMIKDLTKTKDVSGIDEIIINDEEQETIKDSSEVDKKETVFSDKEIEETISNYLNLVGRIEGGPSSVFDLFGYDQDEYMLDDAKRVQAEDGYNEYLETKIKYKEFKKEILNYITEDLFEDEYDKYYIDESGYVYYMSVGASGGLYKLVDVKKLEDNEYEITYDSINPDDSKDRYVMELVIKDVDGKCVVDSHSEVKLYKDNLTSNKIKNKTNDSLGKEIYEKTTISKVFLSKITEIEHYKDSEFTDEEIIKLLPYIDAEKEENKYFTVDITNDGDFAKASNENVQKLAKKYFGREIDIDRLEEKDDNGVSVEIQSGFGIEVFEYRNCFELEDGSYLLEIEEIDETSSGSLVYGLIVDYNEDTEEFIYKGIPSSVIDILSEYNSRK